MQEEGHHINCQIICDANLKFLDAVAKWLGSVHDFTIFNHCGFKRRLELFLRKMPANYRASLIEDSGYARRKIMKIPLTDLTAAEAAYNREKL